jgi:hypothetical protein
MPEQVGDYTIYGKNTIGDSASATFTALEPSLSIDPTCGPPGSPISATGTNWAVDSYAGVYLDGSLVTQNRPDASGNFTMTFAGPVSPGPHTIKVVNSVFDGLSKDFTLPTCPQIGRVVEVIPATDGTIQPKVGDPVYQDETIDSGKDGRVVLLFVDNTLFNTSGTGKVRLDQYLYDPNHQGKAEFNVLRGAIEWLGGKLEKADNKSVFPDTPVGNIGIRGTQFIDRVGATNEEVDLISGAVAISPNRTITTTVFTGPITIVFDGSSTTTSPLTQAQYDAIKAALFPSPSTIPPLVTLDFPAPPSGQAGSFYTSQTPVLGTVSASDLSNVTAISCLDSLAGFTAGPLTGGGTGTASESLSVTGVGTHNITCTATDGANNTGALTGSTNTATIMIAITPPVVTWTMPSAITYGTPLSATQLNATANVPGTFAYTPASGAVLNVGSQKLSVTFTPTDTTNYSTAIASVTLVVNQAVLTATAGNASRAYGAANPAFTYKITGFLNGDTSSVVTGMPSLTTTATPASAAGSYPITAALGTLAAANYSFSFINGTLTVTQATPVITWATPAPINFGTPLGATQLNATSNVAGAFVYSPAAGAVLPVGPNILAATFTPSDATNYTGAAAQVTIVVNSTGKTTPVITWLAPAPITYGTPLSGAQLNATANVAGTFAYSPTAGTILTAGLQTLAVTFTPTNTTAYTNANASINLQVNKAKPFILWLPVPIVYGTPLGPRQLDAVAFAPGTFTHIPGAFAYMPAAGTILGAGEPKLSATFTPTDSADYEIVAAEATLKVFRASPRITWSDPAPIITGTPLSATQLNASANVPGTFTYTPHAGTVLRPGSYELGATFTPTDISNYRSSREEVELTVKTRDVER